ncbi:IMP dehydrogenase [Candidatus Woesearchaeota archaeon]|nr:IMP dehydrogenase [Candidatus Woesearchaeota archaeon]
MAEEIREALSYDDVLLVPRFSNINSRKQVDISTNLTKKIMINLPIVSANMDTVTESSMAISMARHGGIGIIHRFMTIEDQTNEILKVKRSEGILIEKPYTLTPEHIIKDAKVLMENKNITGILITDNVGRYVGILTHRDLMFEDNLLKPISEIMTPKDESITSVPNINIEAAKKLFKEYKVEKLPLVDKNGLLKGLITAKDIMKKDMHPLASKDKKGRLLVGGAIGIKGDYLERAEALINAECDVLCIDIAHGHSQFVVDTIKALRDKFDDVQIIAGNVATAEGTLDLINAGADAIKTGVGGGSICVTRIVTGAGVPQFSAVLDCVKVANEFGIPVIADGGIKQSGDITKALAAGASSVMLGNLLGGTEESPGQTIIRGGRKFKIYRGSAGFGSVMSRKQRENGNDDLSDVVPEGVEGTVPYKGNVSEVLYQLVGGLKSGMSYCGAHNMNELWKNAEFVKITSAGLKESHAHDIDVLK